MAKTTKLKRGQQPDPTDAYDRTKGVTVTMTIWAWGFALYSAQLVLAVISLVGLAFAGIYSDSWVAWFINNTVGNLLGITTDGTFLFMITWWSVMAIGWGTLFGAILQYTSALLHPVSGKAASFKLISLLVAIIGYSVPFANLLPWFTFYTFFVMRYPK